MVHKSFSSLLRKLNELRQSFVELARNDVPGLLAARTYAHGLVTHLGTALRGGNGLGRAGAWWRWAALAGVN